MGISCKVSKHLKICIREYDLLQQGISLPMDAAQNLMYITSCLSIKLLMILVSD